MDVDKGKFAMIVPTKINMVREISLDFYEGRDQWREITEKQYNDAYQNGLPDRDYHEIDVLDKDAFLLDDPIEYGTREQGDIHYGFVRIENRYFARVCGHNDFPRLVARLRSFCEEKNMNIIEEQPEPDNEPIYELRPGLERCAHRMRRSGNQCQLAEGHVGRHACEPALAESVAEIERQAAKKGNS